MQCFLRFFAGTCCALLCVGADSANARRVALVIGNADYKVGRRGPGERRRRRI